MCSGWTHSVVLLNDGKAYIWGEVNFVVMNDCFNSNQFFLVQNHNGELADGIRESRDPVELDFSEFGKDLKCLGISSGHSSLYYYLSNGDVIFQGSNTLAEGGLSHNSPTKGLHKSFKANNLQQFVSINCSVLYVESPESNHLKVFGRSSSGQLGVGSPPFVFEPTVLNCDLFDARDIVSWGAAESSCLLSWSPQVHTRFPEIKRNEILNWLLVSNRLAITQGKHLRVPKAIRMIICYRINDTNPPHL